MDVVLGTDDAVAAKDRLYRALDKALEHKEALERHLAQRWRDLFGAKCDLLLYDLTSTYFEGQAGEIPAARRGYSRDSRPDALQLIMAMVVFGRLWQESGLPEAFQATLKTRRYEFEVERAIYLTVLHRLFASGSDRAAERWREDYLIPGTQGLELHHLYRAMAFLGNTIEQLPKPIGAVRCNK